MKWIAFCFSFVVSSILLFASNITGDVLEEYKIVYEKYVQKPLSCEKNRTSYHSLIAFKPVISKSIIERTSSISIRENISKRKIDLNLEQKGFYGYANLFGKEIHYETWREHCSFGECQINLNFYSNEYDFKTDSGDFSIEFYEKNGERFYKKDIYVESLPNKDKISNQPYVDVTFNTDDFSKYSMSYSSDLSEDFTVVYQFDDLKEKRYEISKTFNKSQFEESISNNEQVSYAAVYVYGSNKNIGYETKIEILSNDDAFKSICEE